MLLTLILFAFVNIAPIPLHRAPVQNPFKFTGNEFTLDNILRRRIFLKEGDVFTRPNLLRSIANVSKLRIVYPVRLNDVFVRLDRTDKLIDLTIRCRSRRTRPTKRAS